MQFLKNLFYNGDEERLRMFWRVIFQTIIFGVLAIPGSILLVNLYSSITGASTAGGLDREAFMTFVTSHPPVMLLNSILTGLPILISVYIAARFFDKRSWKNFGLHRDRYWCAELKFGMLLGAGLMTGIFGLELLLGWVTVTDLFYSDVQMSFFIAILFPLANFIFVGFYEEVWARGYLLTNFAQGFRWLANPKVAVIIGLVISSLIFGVSHASNPNATTVSTIAISLVGIAFLGFGYIITGSLAIPIGAHITWNFFQGNIFGFPVSGTSINSVTLFAIEQQGPELMTGGNFGPESGLLGIIAILAGMAIMAYRTQSRRGELRIVENIAESSEPGVNQG